MSLFLWAVIQTDLAMEETICQTLVVFDPFRTGTTSHVTVGAIMPNVSLNRLDRNLAGSTTRKHSINYISCKPCNLFSLGTLRQKFSDCSVDKACPVDIFGVTYFTKLKQFTTKFHCIFGSF